MLLRNLLSPEKPAYKSLAVLIETFQSHYEPMKLFVMETFKFHQRQQAATESAAEYIAELRKLAIYILRIQRTLVRGIEKQVGLRT